MAKRKTPAHPRFTEEAIVKGFIQAIRKQIQNN